MGLGGTAGEVFWLKNTSSRFDRRPVAGISVASGDREASGGEHAKSGVECLVVFVSGGLAPGTGDRGICAGAPAGAVAFGIEPGGNAPAAGGGGGGVSIASTVALWHRHAVDGRVKGFASRDFSRKALRATRS